MANKISDHLSMRLLAATSACWLLAQMAYYSQTQLLTPVMNSYDVSATSVGFMMSNEIIVFALVALFMAAPMARLPRVKIAFGSCLSLIICNLISVYAPSFEVLSIVRILAGVSAGMIGAIGTASAATSNNPQRAFAIVAVVSGLGFSINAVIFPYFTIPYGALGGYMVMTFVALICAPLMLWLSAPSDIQRNQKKLEPIPSLHSPFYRLGERLGVHRAPNVSIALFAILALVIYEIGQSSLLVYLEQFGVTSGMDLISIGETIGIVGVFGLVGGVIAYWLGERFGNLKPVLVGIFINVSMGAALPLVSNPTGFITCYLLWGISFYFLVPYIFGLITELDKKGRWTVAADAIWWLAAAPGAFIGGFSVSMGGYESLSILAFVTGVISIIIFFLTMNHFYLARAVHSGQQLQTP
jgi:predicted MFS family arabinose efflux permease